MFKTVLSYIIVDVIYILASCDQHYTMQLRLVLLDRFKQLSRLEIFA